MNDNPIPNDIALLREARAFLMEACGRMAFLPSPGCMMFEEIAKQMALFAAALAPGQHDGAAGEGFDPAAKTGLVQITPAIDRALRDALFAALEHVADPIMLEPAPTEQAPRTWNGMPIAPSLTGGTVLLSSTEQARTEGYVLVPREPTEAMLEAGAEGLFGWADDDPKVDVRLIWEGMLDAAMLAAAGDDAVGGRA